MDEPLESLLVCFEVRRDERVDGCCDVDGGLESSRSAFVKEDELATSVREVLLPDGRGEGGTRESPRILPGVEILEAPGLSRLPLGRDDGEGAFCVAVLVCFLFEQTCGRRRDLRGIDLRFPRLVSEGRWTLRGS